MTQKPLYRSLDANLALLEEMFGRSDDFYTKRLMLAGIPCAIVMFTGLSSPEKLCRMALDMLDRDPAMLGGGEGLCDYLLTQSRVPAEPDAVEDRTALVELLSNGLSVLLIDGVRRGVAFFDAGDAPALDLDADERGQPARPAGGIHRTAAQ